MKKWIAIVVAAALAIYLSLPLLMNLLGIYTTQAMIFNGNNAVVSCRYNGQEIELQPGQAIVAKSSKKNNQIEILEGTEGFEETFGPGQYFINLGDARLHLYEQFFPWDEEQGIFLTQSRIKPDHLLYDRTLAKGVHIVDVCWDCCVMLPPNERPYGYLKAENKDKKFILSSRM